MVSGSVSEPNVRRRHEFVQTRSGLGAGSVAAGRAPASSSETRVTPVSTVRPGLRDKAN